MKKIAIEEAIYFEQLGVVRQKWSAKNNFIDTIDRSFYLKEVLPKMIAPLE